MLYHWIYIGWDLVHFHGGALSGAGETEVDEKLKLR